LPALAVDTQLSTSLDRHAIDQGHTVRFAEVFTRVAKDPTTYALPPIIYTAHRLDWDSSHAVRARLREANPASVTGHINDVPIVTPRASASWLQSAMIGRSALNNGICALVERP
jgi:hypothetical protein